MRGLLDFIGGVIRDWFGRISSMEMSLEPAIIWTWWFDGNLRAGIERVRGGEIERENGWVWRITFGLR